MVDKLVLGTSVHDKKIIEHTTTDYYKLGLEGLVAVLKLSLIHI